MRKFEKISFEQFNKDTKLDRDAYNQYQIPRRKTIHSAGYDFEALYDFTLHPNEVLKIPLGIKACMNDGEALLILNRSSMGFKHNVRLTNQVGLIDGDYYNNPENEGHLYLSLQNHSTKNFVIHKGDAICQGVFIPYLKVDEEEEVTDVRKNGLGSTNKGGNEYE